MEPRLVKRIVCWLSEQQTDLRSWMKQPDADSSKDYSINSHSEYPPGIRKNLLNLSINLWISTVLLAVSHCRNSLQGSKSSRCWWRRSPTTWRRISWTTSAIAPMDTPAPTWPTSAKKLPTDPFAPYRSKTSNTSLPTKSVLLREKVSMNSCNIETNPFLLFQVRPISSEDFDCALRQVRASVSTQDLALYEDWNSRYGSGAKWYQFNLPCLFIDS